jgi:hypothetical protein
MKLKKSQREALLAWIAEGLETDEINERASKHKPKFKVTRQQVDFYRKSRKHNIHAIKKSGEFSALISGLSVRENRVQLLHELAELLRADLFENSKLWLLNKKAIGMTEVFCYEDFNAAEVAQLRGVLDDIAQEMSERGKMPNVGLNVDFSKLNPKQMRAIQNATSIEEVAAIIANPDPGAGGDGAASAGESG